MKICNFRNFKTLTFNQKFIKLIVLSSLFQSPFTYTEAEVQVQKILTVQDSFINPHDIKLSTLDEQINRQLIKISKWSFQQRLQYWLHYFVSLKTPYLTSPLGEGVDDQLSPGPLYRFDGFDCTTFVETVLALSHAQNFDEFTFHMQSLRYQGQRINYFERNHFTSLDWIPNNTQKGYIEDITQNVFDFSQTTFTKIDKGQWFLKQIKNHPQIAQSQKLIEMINQIQPQVVALNYIPKDKLLALLKNDEIFVQKDGKNIFSKLVNQMYIFNTVRKNWNIQEKIGTDLDVSHQGFIIFLENRGVYIIHAKNNMTITLEPLYDYVLQKFMANDSVQGLNLLEIKGLH